jgi:hypothetical protein
MAKWEQGLGQEGEEGEEGGCEGVHCALTVRNGYGQGIRENTNGRGELFHGGLGYTDACTLRGQ